MSGTDAKREPRKRVPRAARSAEVEVLPKAVTKSQRDVSHRPPPDRRDRIAVVLEGRMAQLYRGELSVADMDDEELQRMQFRDKNGNFTGRPPSNLPGSLVKLIQAEILARAAFIRTKRYTELVSEQVRLALHAEEEGTRLRAINAVIERVEGKEPVKVEVKQDAPFMIDMQVGIKRIDPGPEGIAS